MILAPPCGAGPSSCPDLNPPQIDRTEAQRQPKNAPTSPLLKVEINLQALPLPRQPSRGPASPSLDPPALPWTRQPSPGPFSPPLDLPALSWTRQSSPGSLSPPPDPHSPPAGPPFVTTCWVRPPPPLHLSLGYGGRLGGDKSRDNQRVLLPSQIKWKCSPHRRRTTGSHRAVR